MRRPGCRRWRRSRAADHDPGDGQIPEAVLGLDIGGSSSRARLRDAANATRDADGPGANVATLDPAVVDDRITRLVAGMGDIHPRACCAGAAGAEVEEGRARLDALLRRLLPESRVCVVHDARLVLAAAGLDSGIALIAGTGSVAYGRTTDGREAQRGGWGWMIGDEGSGVWIAREAARLIMVRSELGSELGELAEAMFAACGVRDARQLLLRLHSMHEARQWAALATSVFETFESDAGSRDIIGRAGGELAKRAVEVGDALRVKDAVVLAGGLLLNQPHLEDAVRKSLPDRQCVRLQEPPVEGAVRLAEELLRT